MTHSAPLLNDYSAPFLLLDGVDLRLVLRHLSDSVFVSDAEGRILLLNPMAQQLLGLNANGTEKLFVQDFLKQGVYEPSTALEAAEKKTTITRNVHSSLGHDIMAISRPVLDENGNVVMVITSSRSKQLIDEFLTRALAEEQQKTERYRQAASVLSETLQQDKPIAVSPAMQSVMTLADSVAPTDTTVLLSGESGTGKEVVAHYIHQHSRRADEPFIPVNCGAVPHELMEAEFFGYVRGAFTGANPQGKPGLFEMAHRGTLFLDEVGEMPLVMQSKLLRVLETGIVRRLGATKGQKMDVRIIAASNRDLYEMARQDRFRIDLYYRLHVIPVEIPPLRDRPEDICELAERFLADCNKRYGKHCFFTPGALESLTRYAWPGNVRELRNVVERLAMIGRQQLDDTACTGILFAPSSRQPSPLAGYPAELPLRDFRKQVETDYIRTMLERYNGNVTKTAKALRIHKTALYRKLHGMGLMPE